MPILGTIASSTRQGLVTSSYFSLATAVVSTSVPNIEWANISSAYQHLQIRAVGRTTSSSGASFIVRFGTGGGGVDSGANYTFHQTGTDGSSPFMDGSGSYTDLTMPQVSNATHNGSMFGGMVMDILDYANTNKFKTVKGIGGWDNNTSGLSLYRTGVWRNTGAIDRIQISPTSGNWAQFSHFALYGIRSA